jgi:hypothetical protein
MENLSLSLKRTDQSDILQGDVSISHIVNICNHKIPQDYRTVNGTMVLCLKRKDVSLLKDIGKWIINVEGTSK